MARLETNALHETVIFKCRFENYRYSAQREINPEVSIRQLNLEAEASVCHCFYTFPFCTRKKFYFPKYAGVIKSDE